MFASGNSIEKFEKVKLPQIETVSRFYQPRKNRKSIRIFTVAIYVLCVSLAAIMLSLYYVYLWDPTLKPYIPKSSSCEKLLVPEQIAIRLMNSTEITIDQFYKNILHNYQMQQNLHRHKYINQFQYHKLYRNRNHKNNHQQRKSLLPLALQREPDKIPSTIISQIKSTENPIHLIAHEQNVNDDEDLQDLLGTSSGFGINKLIKN